MTDLFTDIGLTRFNALAGYCRHPQTLSFTTELRWLQSHDETILAVLVKDHDDEDFGALVLTKDLKERYRFFNMTSFYRTPEEVLAVLPELITSTVKELEIDRAQGDEKGKPVDFFTPIVAAARLHEDFAKLSTLEGYSPALELIKPMMRWHEDADGNFIEQFQTTGFNTRLWELYIFAMLTEARYAFDKESAIPDFCATSVLGEICIEATSVNPSVTRDGQPVAPPPMATAEEQSEFIRNYMPIRFAGPLLAKLSKEYWARNNVAGRPLILAVQDFHAPGSMVYSRSALPIYLYGMEWGHEHLETGELLIKPRKITSHQWGTKNVSSGFFDLPGSENISAVITNASATISKFNRIGVRAGFGSKRVKMIRRGTAGDPDPTPSAPLIFEHDVNGADYKETWIEGLDVFHNPNALIPLQPSQLSGAAHHRLLKDGQLQTLAPDWHPFASLTHIFLID